MNSDSSHIEAEFLKVLGDTFTPYVGREEGTPLPRHIRDKRAEQRRQEKEAKRLERERKALAEIKSRDDARLLFVDLANVICASYDVTYESILSSDRALAFFIPRSHLMWLARTRLGMRWVEIARLMKRDHATIINGVRVFEERYATSPKTLEVTRMLDRATQPPDPDT